MRKFILVICLFFVLGGVFGVEINGSLKAASATNITQGVYEDDMYNQNGDKYYKINVPKPSKVRIQFEIEPGTHSQAIEYEFKGSTLRNDVIHKEYFAGQARSDISFEDSFDIGSAGNYILKISKYNNRFLGDYIFEISFTCLDRENTSGLECVNGEWVDGEWVDVSEEVPEPEEVLIEEPEPVLLEVEEDVCDGCLLDDVCYEVGTLFNESFCSKDGDVLSFLENGVSCSFDYECLSGECEEERCYELGLWDKVVEFFKGLF